MTASTVAAIALAEADRLGKILEDKRATGYDRADETTQALLDGIDTANAAAELATDLVNELRAAHKILRIAVSYLNGSERERFVTQVSDAGLDGEGDTTRAAEREALLMRAGAGS